MAALAEVIQHPASAPHDEPREIVAVILEDGTVRDLRSDCDSGRRRRISLGQLSGSDWILWWERRAF